METLWPIMRLLFDEIGAGELHHFVTPSHGAASPFSTVWSRFGSAGLEQLDLPYVPADVWRDSELMAAARFDVAATYYFPAGVSYGIMAAIHAAFVRGDKILVGRNVHRSVVAAVVTLGAEIAWLCPKGPWFSYDSESLSAHLDAHSDAAGVILTNPSYEGDCSDISAIATICRKRSALLVVDESLGSHWPGCDTECVSALADADLVLHSAHKRLGALVPAGLLHVTKQSRVPLRMVDEYARLFPSSSASNAVLLSIELAVQRLFGHEHASHVATLVERAARIRSALRSLESPSAERRRRRDPLLIHFVPHRRNPVAVAEVAYNQGCNYEHADGRGIAYFVSPCASVEPLELLSRVLPDSVNSTPPEQSGWFEYDAPTMQLDPNDAAHRDAEEVVIEEGCVGRIAASLVAPCPPGIPLLVPGQEVSPSHVCRLRGRSVRLVRK